jgi:probable rRNA maturation factor
VFLGDSAMRSLNRKYRNKDKTTDVLSFPMHEGGRGRVQPDVLGDIVISLPTAERQARELGHSVRAEIDRLLVHGLAHLVGFDHERGPAAERAMQRKERDLLRKAGW